MNTYKDCWAQNNETRIHYIEKGQPSLDQLSLVASLGIWESAERAIPLFDKLQRHCIALSYRGRGKSDTPSTGYDFEQHVGDLATVIESAQLDSLCLLAFSRGVPYAIGYTLEHLDKVVGLILVDQPPIQNKWPEGGADFWKNLIYREKPVTNFIRPAALDRIEQEARRVELWDSLHRIECPVLILRGLSDSHAISSDLSEQDALKYQRLLKNAREEGFEHSGHMIPDDEPDKYADTVRGFLAKLDRQAQLQKKKSA
jgi:pimeloyl-ACP methyl ester carboxylesterase